MVCVCVACTHSGFHSDQIIDRPIIARAMTNQRHSRSPANGGVMEGEWREKVRERWRREVESGMRFEQLLIRSLTHYLPR